uniref:Uncharacterized protein n=1 Tax=Takifugu rubripes TaxID=31033 RepID=A0A674PNC7_TAKRU
MSAFFRAGESFTPHPGRKELSVYTLKKIYLYSSAPTFANSIGHSGTRGVNHGHEANEAQVLGGEVHLISVKSKAFWELVIKHVEMAKT